MARPHCICHDRSGIRCDESGCDLAAPPQVGSHGGCVICWQYHYSEPHRRALGGEGPAKPAPVTPPKPPPLLLPAAPAPPAKTAPAAEAVSPERKEKLRHLLKRLELPCVHLGSETGERHDCLMCGGQKQQSVLACALHGRCVWKRRLGYRDKGGRWIEERWCVTCPDYRTKEATDE